MLKLFDGDLGTRETLRFIEEKLGAGIWNWNLLTGEMEWSRGFFALLGLDHGSVTPSYAAIERMTHPEDRRPADDLHRLHKEGLPFEREFRVIRPNGRIRWILGRSEILVDSCGRPTRSVGVSFDVTKHHEEVRSIALTNARYHALIQATEGVVWVTHADGSANRLSTLGQSIVEPRTEPPVVHWADLVHQDDRDAIDQQWTQATSSRMPQRLKHRSRQPDGTFRWTRTVAVPTADEQHGLPEWICVSTDIDLEENYAPSSSKPARITGAQIRAARGLLALSVKDLAEMAQVSPATIRRFEEVDGAPDVPENALKRIERAITEAGVELIFPQIGKPGIRPR